METVAPRLTAPPIAAHANPTRTGTDTWKGAYRLGGIVAFVALGCMMLDVALTMLPGWGTAAVPTTAAGWFGQFASSPLVGIRNLDLLNVCVSVMVMPMYLALSLAMRRTSPALAAVGLVAVVIGTALFASANAALPMLQLSRQYSATSDPSTRAALVAAAEALLARGAHGSLGAFPGFFLSEVGTLLIACGMLSGRVFGKPTAWIGIVGATILVAYTTAYTFGSADNALVIAVAIPGGLLMIAWHALVGRKLILLPE